MLFFFFFQAEDGIRDGHVTGVQTCALPISEVASLGRELGVCPRTVPPPGKAVASGLHSGLAALQPRRRDRLPEGGRERRRTTSDALSPRCDCAFSTERRPVLLSRHAVACRRGRRIRGRGEFSGESAG